MIAAGGTAGHVRPALAVAEALRARGVTVTFAGSPDRVESRLVPEAGFELDTFAISGFPRRPSARRSLRALVRGRRARRSPAAAILAPAPAATSSSAAAATSPGRWCSPRACAAIPAALTEADAHLGLANRLAAPFARRVFLAYAIAGPRRREVPRRRPADPGRASRRRAGRGARAASGCPPDGPVLAVFGALAGARSAERVRRRGVRRARARRCCTSPASATTSALRPRVHRERLRARPVDGRVRRGARRGRPRDLARGRDGLGARRGRHAGDPRPVPARDGRPPDAERAPLRARRRRGRRRPRRELDARAGARRRAARPTRRGSRAMREAMLRAGAAGRRGRDRRGADRACRGRR